MVLVDVFYGKSLTGKTKLHADRGCPALRGSALTWEVERRGPPAMTRLCQRCAGDLQPNELSAAAVEDRRPPLRATSPEVAVEVDEVSRAEVDGYLPEREVQWVLDWLGQVATDSVHTERAYRGELGRFLGFLTDACDGRTLSSARRSDVVAYRSYLLEERGLSRSSFERARSALSSFYTWATDPAEHEPGVSPLPETHPNIARSARTWRRSASGTRQRTRAISQGDLLKLQRVATPHERALLLGLATTGARVSELTGRSRKGDDGHRVHGGGATRGDLQIDDEAVRLTLDAKGGKHREVTLTPVLVELLGSLGMLSPSRSKRDLLFVQESGEPWDPDRSVRSLMRSLCQRAGMAEEVSPHRFRAYYIVALLKAGVPVQDVQRLVGHADVSTTLGYATDSQHDELSMRTAKYLAALTTGKSVTRLKSDLTI